MYNVMEVNLRDLMHAMYYVHGALPRYANDGTDTYIRYYVRYDIMQALLFRGVRYYMSYVPDQARHREFACELAWWAHSYARGPCVGKYHASTLLRQSKGLRPWEGMEDRPLSRFLSFDTCACVCVLYAIACILMYDYMLNPNSGATYWVFYIILKPRATHIFR